MDDQSIGTPSQVQRIILCSGKIFYDLTAEKEKNPEIADNVAILRMEQLYPFPGKTLSEMVAKYPKAKKIVWAQEEPMNMGGWYYARHRLEQFLGESHDIEYVGRKGSGTTAEGSGKAHAKEQSRIVKESLGIGSEGGQIKIAAVNGGTAAHS